MVEGFEVAAHIYMVAPSAITGPSPGPRVRWPPPGQRVRARGVHATCAFPLPLSRVPRGAELEITSRATQVTVCSTRFGDPDDRGNSDQRGRSRRHAGEHAELAGPQPLQAGSI